ncbi:MAG: sigma-54 dependent transcriptional regulator [Desulfohalobiaceae bacterium]|nr:sigma-54 dependent transcriptional regulator [Desulfohalobiaceae bacterium]
MAGKTILLIDDDRQLCESFARVLSEEGYFVLTAHSARTGLKSLRENRPNLIVLDIRLPDLNGLQVLQAVQEEQPKLPVVMITAYDSTETAIEAIKLGAFDYVYKPFEPGEMLRIVPQALEAGRYMTDAVAVDPEPDAVPSAEAIIGRSKKMLEVYKSIGRVSDTDATVLIRGESGTGKELVARAVYQHSVRRNKPFLVINCVAIPETLLESELFGYERGAFTGAIHRKIGKIEQANKGTVFLDEIGDMPLSIQAKILRLLQEKSIERLGGGETIPLDVRIIGATNRNLEQAVAEGKFRKDLYYRLKVVSIRLPPLRERKEDIPLLSRYLLGTFALQMKRENPGITPEALEYFQGYAWPGNIRELSNVLQRALIFTHGTPIQANDIALGEEPPERYAPPQQTEETVKDWILFQLRNSKSDHVFETCLDRFTALLLEQALNLTSGNRSQAARLLGVSRPTLHSKMEKLGISIQSSARDDSAAQHTRD